MVSSFGTKKMDKNIMHTFGFVWEALYKLQYKKIRCRTNPRRMVAGVGKGPGLNCNTLFSALIINNYYTMVPKIER